MEDLFIEWLKSVSEKTLSARAVNPEQGGVPTADIELQLDSLVTGIGDDAAVIEWNSGQRMVVTSDSIGDGTHFNSDSDSLELIGRKAMAVNLSDLAAMAARPRYASVNYFLPRDMDVEQVKQLFTGSAELARELGVKIVGGDTNSWDGPLTISITAIGSIPKTATGSWLMSAGREGDAILVTGVFGGSLLGHHLRFTPRCELALYLRENYEVHAATDVSDSLAIDLRSLVRSSGCGAVLNLNSIPVSTDARNLAQSSGQKSLEHALYDGEDFELILTCNPTEAARIIADTELETKVTLVGHLDSGEGIRNSRTGNSVEIRGYRH